MHVPFSHFDSNYDIVAEMQEHFLDLFDVVLVHNVSSKLFQNKELVLSHTCMFNGYGQVRPESLQVTSQGRTFHRLPRVKSVC